MEELQQEKGNEQASSRKRKVKFSEREQETLIEELVPHHDELFGKKSLRVPEATKRKLWLQIQEKVNSVGVTHRTIKDLAKRWYDMRLRSKERIAERLREAASTGGGPSTSTNPTPHEELVETTLLPESVVGVSDMDSSVPAASKQAQHQSQAQDRETEEEGDVRVDMEEQDSEDNTEPERQMSRRRRRHISPLPLLEAYSHESHMEEEQAGTVQPERQVEALQDTQPRSEARHRHRARAVHRHRHGDESGAFLNLERSMLETQRLQQKAMRSINRQFNTLNRNVTNMDISLTRAIDRLTHAVREEHASRHRTTQRLIAQLGTYTMAVNRLCATTSALSRRSTTMQVAMVHCCQDVARGLAQVTTAVEQLQTMTAGGDVLLHGGDTEDTTSRSSITPPVPTERRRSERHASNLHTSPEGGVQPVHPRGGRSRRQ